MDDTNGNIMEFEIKVTDEEIECLGKEELADLIMLRLNKLVEKELKEKAKTGKEYFRNKKRIFSE